MIVSLLSPRAVTISSMEVPQEMKYQENGPFVIQCNLFFLAFSLKLHLKIPSDPLFFNTFLNAFLVLENVWFSLFILSLT